MSFALTEEQLLAGQKDVTRRLGWLWLKPGDQVRAVRKAMGLRKGERVHVLGTIRVVSVRREPLCRIDLDDCRREGFPRMTPSVFVTFFASANSCSAEALVTRIEFVFTPTDTADRSQTDGRDQPLLRPDARR